MCFFLHSSAFQTGEWCVTQQALYKTWYYTSVKTWIRLRKTFHPSIYIETDLLSTTGRWLAHTSVDCKILTRINVELQIQSKRGFRPNYGCEGQNQNQWWKPRESSGTKAVGPACSNRAPICEFVECLLWIPKGCNNTGDALRRHWKRLEPNWLIKPDFFLRMRLILKQPGGRAGCWAVWSGLAVTRRGAKLASPCLTLQTWQTHGYLTPGSVPAHLRFRIELVVCQPVGFRGAFLLCTPRLWKGDISIATKYSGRPYLRDRLLAERKAGQKSFYICVCVFVCVCNIDFMLGQCTGSSCTSCCFHCGSGLKKAEPCASVSVSRTWVYQTVLINIGANCFGVGGFQHVGLGLKYWFKFQPFSYCII